MTLTKALLPATLISMALVGCGGDSSSSSADTRSADTSGVIERLQYTGETGAATLTEENMGEFTEVTTAVIQNYKSTRELFETYDEVLRLIIEPVMEPVMEPGFALLEVAIPAPIDEQPSEELPAEGPTNPVVEEGDCGGKVTITLDDFGGPTLFEKSIEFADYCVGGDGDQQVVNGTINQDVEVLTDEESGDFVNYGKITRTFRSVTVSVGEQSATLTGVVEENPNNGDMYNSIKVTANGQTRVMAFEASCPDSNKLRRECVSSESEYVKIGNTTYRIDEGGFNSDTDLYSETIDGTAPVTEEYYFEGHVFLPAYGRVEVDAYNLTFCESGNIEYGFFDFFDDSNNEASAFFDACDTAPELDFTAAPVIEQPPSVLPQ